MHVRSCHRQVRQNGNIRIKGCKGFALQLLRERMPTIETVRPSADCDDLVQPRMQSLYQGTKSLTSRLAVTALYS